MRFHVRNFRVRRFRAPSVAAPGGPAGRDVAAGDVSAAAPGLVSGDLEIGHPTAESQQAGLDHLARIGAEQAAAWLAGQRAQAGTADHAAHK
jgi:hypothetical protein